LKKFEKVGSEVVKTQRKLLKGVVVFKPLAAFRVKLFDLECLSSWLLADVRVSCRIE
jgi:hypothetical protein